MRKTKKKSGGPARNLIECSPFRNTGGGQVPGKTSGEVQHESSIEKGVIALLALCRDVCHIASQPEELTYAINDEVHRYIPDFKIKTTFIDGDLYLEAKSIYHLVRPDSLAKYSAIARDLRKRGTPLVFLVDAQLEEKPLADWVGLLARYTTGDLRRAEADCLRAALAAGPLRVKQLLDAGHALVDIWTMVAKHQLSIDWQRGFYPFEAHVSLPNSPYQEFLLEDILHSSRFGGFLGELALGRGTPDQRIVALAQTWRQRRRPYGIDGNIGGDLDTTPLHPDPPEGLAAPVARYGGHPAPGLAINASTHTA